MPAGAVHDRLAGLIRRLAERFSTPPFPPHVTLLPGIDDPREEETLATCRTLAAAIRPFTVRLAGVEGRAEPFRCLFARAEASALLLATHAAAARAFGREPDAPFFPHLSLVYGAVPDETKREIATDVAPLVAPSFPVARLHLWRTDGPVGDWRELGALDLTGA